MTALFSDLRAKGEYYLAMEPSNSNPTDNSNNNNKKKRVGKERESQDGLGGLNPPPSKRSREIGGSSGGDGNLSSSFDFEKHRLSFTFKQGEIWAVRDAYGMPRRYVLIDKDGDAHSASFRFLMHDIGSPEYRLLFKGVFACGIYAIDNGPVPLEPPAFSHKVVGWVEERRTTYSKYNIYPRKGEVWAIARCKTLCAAILGLTRPILDKYQMVEVLEDYNSEKGPRVVPLVMVKSGYCSLFRQHPGEGGQKFFYIAPEDVDLLRFSHQVPYKRVSREISREGPIYDSLELDPSCLPLYLDDPQAGLKPMVSDNYLYLFLLEKKAMRVPHHSSIWAAYHCQHRVPLKYVSLRLKKVGSKAKLVMHELVPSPNNENERKWREAGLPIACGRFMVSPTKTNYNFALSHEVSYPHKVAKMLNGDYYDIYPGVGEVWGVYKDKNIARACNPEGALHYQIVEIVKKGEKGIEVAPLHRAGGFKSLFRRKSDRRTEVNFLIPADEVYRFSHCIPSTICPRIIPGELEGTFVLDPFLVPWKDTECFSFTDLFLLERPRADPLWSHMQYIVNEERKRISLVCQENNRQQCGTSNTNIPVAVPRSHDTESEASGHENLYQDLNIKFHDFDDPKSEKSFELGQIWALYSAFDGLPHSYARLDKFITSRGMVEVTLLEPHPVTEEEMHWVEENLPMACGTFRASKSTCIKDIMLFSHRVICNEGEAVKFFKVFPRKGEVWAIYKHWDFSWTCSNMKDNAHYKLVEVVSDYTEEAGVTVAALVRAEAHEDVFRRQLHEGFGLFVTFKRKELLRFSCCVPSLKMMGDENDNGSTYGGTIKIKFSCNGI